MHLYRTTDYFISNSIYVFYRHISYILCVSVANIPVNSVKLNGICTNLFQIRTRILKIYSYSYIRSRKRKAV